MDDRTSLPTRMDAITSKNVLDRIVGYCAVRSKERGGVHPIVRKGDPEFMLWWEYFARHLGKVPWAFQLAINEPIRSSFTAPEPDPSWFDSSFRPLKGWMPPQERWEEGKTSAEREEYVLKMKRQLSNLGFSFGGPSKTVETVDRVIGKYGISQEQWNALPDLPKNHEDKASNRRR